VKYKPLISCGSTFYRTVAGVISRQKRKKKEALSMRGYHTGTGFYGLVGARYVLFASESDYYEFMAEEE
jgi:hypothetical protein